MTEAVQKSTDKMEQIQEIIITQGVVIRDKNQFTFYELSIQLYMKPSLEICLSNWLLIIVYFMTLQRFFRPLKSRSVFFDLRIYYQVNQLGC